MNLKIKFIMPTLILILAGMSVTTWLTYQRSTDSMTDDAVDKSRTSLIGLQSAVELWVEGAQNEIVSLSKTDEAANALLHGSSDPEKLERALALLQDSKSRHAPFDNIFLIDRSGSAVVCTNPRMVGADMKERTYFREAITGRDFISNPLFSADGGEPVFVIAAPVRSEGKTIGIISVGIRIGHFTEKFVKPLDTPGGYAFILAPDGLVLAHPDGNLVGKLNVFNDTDYGPKIASQKNGSLETAAHGFDCLLLFKKSQMTGWVVGMAVNKDAAFAEARGL
ncbi:MAG: hypothetical protein GYA47_00945, partial [Desulfovibrio sp.]|nr:hypothetical protein [Desulfovibrio sp.]